MAHLIVPLENPLPFSPQSDDIRSILLSNAALVAISEFLLFVQAQVNRAALARTWLMQRPMWGGTE